MLIPNSSDNTTSPNNYFCIAELDALLSRQAPPILELVSSPPAHHPTGSGKTSLLYLLIAKAILPVAISPSIPVMGKEAAVILFDPVSHFSIPRLVSVMLSLLESKLSAANIEIDEPAQVQLKSMVKRSLVHLHIFRPKSWPSLLSTLCSMPDYLFDRTRHKSVYRRVHSLILEDMDTFVWSIRGSASAVLNAKSSDVVSTASTQLIAQIQSLSTLLSCATILTSCSALPSALRPALPLSWPQGSSVTRLALRRLEVIRFAPTISVDEAEAERQQRWEVVGRGRFECCKVGIGVKDDEGFMFRVGNGVEIEKVVC